MFTENVDYVIYHNDQETYDREEIVNRMRKIFAKPESSINELRRNNPLTASATLGDDVDCYGYTPEEYDDSVEASFQAYLHDKMLKFGNDILGKTGKIVYNNFVCVRIGAGCCLLSHVHPEDNDGVCVIALENRNLGLEFVMTETGKAYRAKEDISENERLSLFLENGDTLIILPKIEHLLATLPENEETVYMAINFKFQD